MFSYKISRHVHINFHRSSSNIEKCEMFCYIIDPDMCIEISIDLQITWQNVRCSVLLDPDLCIWNFP